MFSAPPLTRLAELLAELDWSQAELAAASHLSVATVARALRGEQVQALSRALLVAALNRQRATVGLAELRASEVFPTG